jgi:hypothetical protein
MFRTLRAWWVGRKKDGGKSPALDTPEKEADLMKLISSAQSNLPGRPQ